MNNQKTARVILMTSYGADIFPSEIEDNVRAVMKSDGPLWRLNSNLISKIDSLKYLDLDVDITRPWMICSYDGREYIKYLDETKLISEEYNLYQEILN